MGLVPPRRLRRVGSCHEGDLAWGGDGGTEELGVEGTQLFRVYLVALKFALEMKNGSSLLEPLCLQQCDKEKQSDIVMYGSSL